MPEAEALNDPEAASLLARCPIALLPLGALESHGAHLPAGTDNILAGRLAAALEAAVPELPILRLPVLPFGSVWSLETAPGSVGISGATLAATLCEIGAGLQAKGVRAMAIVNAHLGNAPYIRDAQRSLGARGFPVAAFFYPGAGAEVRRVRDTPEAHPAFMHACEIETSYMLHLAPEAVRMELAEANYPEFPEFFDCLQSRWTDFSASAVLGDPRAASSGKGETILGPVIARMAAVLRHLHEEGTGS